MDGAFQPYPQSLQMTLAKVHMDFPVDSIVDQLTEAMHQGSNSETFIRKDDLTKVGKGDIHPMQASRLKALGWTVERNGATYSVSGWGIPYA